MHFFGIPHGEVEEFPSIKKKKQQQWDKYVFNVQTETGVRSRGILSEFTEGQHRSLEMRVFPPFPTPGRRWACFPGSAFPSLQGLLVTRGAAESLSSAAPR